MCLIFRFWIVSQLKRAEPTRFWCSFQGHSPVFMGRSSTRTSGLLHSLHHLPLQNQAALGQGLGLVPGQLGLLTTQNNNVTSDQNRQAELLRAPTFSSS